MNCSTNFILVDSYTLDLKAETKVISHHGWKQYGILLEPLLVEVQWGTGQPRFNSGIGRSWAGKQVGWLFHRANLELLELWWEIPWDMAYGKEYSMYFHTVLTAHTLQGATLLNSIFSCQILLEYGRKGIVRPALQQINWVYDTFLLFKQFSREYSLIRCSIRW